MITTIDKPLSELTINELKSKLGNFFNYNLNQSKLNEFNSKLTQLTTSMRIAIFGTGTGKSFNSLNGYFDAFIHDKHHYTHLNCVYISSKKNQLTFSNAHIDRANQLGITLVSNLSDADMVSKTTTLFGAKKGQTLADKLINDLIPSIDFILEQFDTQKTINSIHVNKPQLINIRKCLALLKANLNDYEYYSNRIAFDSQVSPEQLSEWKKIILSKQYDFKNTSQKLSKMILENAPSALIIFKEDESHNDPQAETDSKFNNSYPYFYNKQAVKNNIFDKAIPKTHYDSPILESIKQQGDLHSKVATLKRDILRLYSPLTFSMFNPSIIIMTHAKMLKPSGFFYQVSKINKQGEMKEYWVTHSYDSGIELFGDKKSKKVVIPKIIDEEAQRNYLMENLYCHYNSDSENLIGSYSHCVNYYMLIDEVNLLFTDMSSESDSNNDNKYVSIQQVQSLKDTSITDILLVAGLIFGIDKDPINQDFVREYRSFCDKFTYFFYESSQYDKSEFDLRQVMKRIKGSCLQFYVNNSDVGVLTDLIQSTFVANPRIIINKVELLNFYVCLSDTCCFITTDKDVYTKIDPDCLFITLYDFYLIILSCLYASHFYSKNLMPYNDLAVARGQERVMTENKTEKQIRYNFTLSLTEKVGQNNLQGGGGRVNFPIRDLIGEKLEDLRYIDLLNSNDDSETDIIGHWFAQVQTLLIFNLTALSQQELKNTSNMKQKTLLKVSLSLRNHTQELELLKSMVGTDNYLFLMSATAGKQNAHASQFNIETLAYFNKMLGIKMDLPKYDYHTNTDFSKVAQALYLKQDENCKVSINIYNQSNNSYSNDSVEKAYTLFIDTLKKYKNDYNYSYLSPYPQRYYEDMTRFMFGAIYRGEGMLAITANSRFVMDMQKFMLNGTGINSNYEHFKSVIDTYIKTYEQTKIFKPLVFTFYGECGKLFNKFTYPLLNNALEMQIATKNIGASEIKNLIKYDKNLIKIIDFLDLPRNLNKKSTCDYRLVLLDGNLFKSIELFDYTIIDHSPYHTNHTITTGMMTYSATADTGLNLTIDNRITKREENCPNIAIVGTKFFSNMRLNSLSEVQQMIARNHYLANIPYSNEIVTIKELNDRIMSASADSFIKKEHEEICIESNTQVIGRGERASYPDTTATIHMDKNSFNEYSDMLARFYALDDDFKPTTNLRSYQFLSHFNRKMLETVIDKIASNSLSIESRERLQADTILLQPRIIEFTDTIYLKILSAMRNNEGSRKELDEYKAFDYAYRSYFIFTDPIAWQTNILKTAYVKKNKELFELFSSVVINLAYYDKEWDSKDIHLYIIWDKALKGVALGLTDTIGNTQGYNKHQVAYNKPYRFLPQVDFGWGKFRKPKRVQGDSDILNDFTYIAHSRFFDSYNDIGQSHYKQYLIHPALYSMILGNIGEYVFNKFFTDVVHYYESAKYYSNKETGTFVKDLTDIYPDRPYHKLYEKYDFFINKKKIQTVIAPHDNKSYLLVDVKNMAIKGGKAVTTKLKERQISKFDFIEQFSEVFYDDNNSNLDTLTLNIRSVMDNKQVVIEPILKHLFIDKQGIERTITNYSCMLFSKFLVDVNQLDETKKYSDIENIVIINPTLLALFDLPLTPIVLSHLFFKQGLTL